MPGHGVGRVPPTGPLDPSLVPLVRHPGAPRPAATPAMAHDHTQFSAFAGPNARRGARLTTLLTDPAVPPQPVTLAPVARTTVAVSQQLLPVDAVQRNLVITASYQKVHAAFQAYLGEPRLTDWSGLAIDASSEVGVQLRDARDIRSTMQALTDGKHGNDAKALSHLYARMGDDGAMSKALGLMMTSAGFSVDTLEGLGKALLQGGTHFLGEAKDRSVNAMIDSLTTCEHQLAAGNRAIFLNIAPAYEVFLAAEAAHRDGVAALQASPAGHDAPLLVEAFTYYKLAKATPDVTQRRQYVQLANLLIARHEQANIVQPFMEPIKGELRMVSDSLTFQPPGGGPRVKLFPNGGDWANVDDRLKAIGMVNAIYLDHDMQRLTTKPLSA